MVNHYPKRPFFTQYYHYFYWTTPKNPRSYCHCQSLANWLTEKAGRIKLSSSVVRGWQMLFRQSQAQSQLWSSWSHLYHHVKDYDILYTSFLHVVYSEGGELFSHFLPPLVKCIIIYSYRERERDGKTEIKICNKNKFSEFSLAKTESIGPGWY